MTIWTHDRTAQLRLRSRQTAGATHEGPRYRTVIETLLQIISASPRDFGVFSGLNAIGLQYRSRQEADRRGVLPLLRAPDWAQFASLRRVPRHRLCHRATARRLLGVCAGQAIETQPRRLLSMPECSIGSCSIVSCPWMLCRPGNSCRCTSKRIGASPPPLSVAVARDRVGE